MNCFKYDDMLCLDSSARKGLGEVVLYVVFHEEHGWEKLPNSSAQKFIGGGPCVFLRCVDALEYAAEFAMSIQGYIRQEVHKPGQTPKVRTFSQVIVDRADEPDSYIAYDEVELKNNY